MSVEGKIMERDGIDGKTIKKCKINAVALTFNPVNSDTYANLVKSMNASAEIEFDSTEENIQNETNSEKPTFTASQVVEMMEKALTAGVAGEKAPVDRQGGEALAQESLESEKLCKTCKSSVCKGCEPKKMKKGNEQFYKSQMKRLLEDLQELHPDATRSELWEAVKDRLARKFPENM